jgi:hypothetical protein
MSAAYVERVSPLCAGSGCQFSGAQQILNQAREVLESRDHMSAALWCDQGGHAFSERDPGRQRITVNTLDEETEREVQISKDFCGGCADQAGLNGKRKTRPTLPAVSDGDDGGGESSAHGFIARA